MRAPSIEGGLAIRGIVDADKNTGAPNPTMLSMPLAQAQYVPNPKRGIKQGSFGKLSWAGINSKSQKCYYNKEDADYTGGGRVAELPLTAR